MKGGRMRKSRWAAVFALVTVGAISLPLLAVTVPAAASARPGTAAEWAPLKVASPMPVSCGPGSPRRTHTVLTTPDGTTVPGNEPVSVTATVDALGEVEFFINGKEVEGIDLTGGQATASLSLPAGGSTVKAHYTGEPCQGPERWTYEPSTSNAITFTTTPPYTPTVHRTASYSKPTSTTVKVTIHMDVQGFTGYGTPSGTVSADDSFTCGALTPISGRIESRATCKAVVPITTSEGVDISYSGDSTYAPAEVSLEVSVAPPPPSLQPVWNLFGVSCTSAKVCKAVGSSPSGTLAETWNGGEWTIDTTPNPIGATSSGLSEVSCTSATACMAVGHYSNSAYPSLTLAEAWNGTTWAIEPTPNDGPLGSEFTGVSCTSATACTAVGATTLSADSWATLAEAWNGTTWTIEPTPEPIGGLSGGLASVSCTSATACTAVGRYEDSAGNRVTLAEAWNGTAWTIEPTPNPVVTILSGLYGVSCTSPKVCVAVGWYANSAGDPLAGFVETWNATTWAIEPIEPTGLWQYLFGVSCSSAKACTVVGSDGLTADSWVTLAEARDGTAWTIEPTPSPGPGPSLLGVSCTSASRCTAVGNVSNGTLGETLAEAWNGKKWAIEPTPIPT
jgi:hypothetical protein